MLCLSNSNTAGFSAKQTALGSQDYADRVAKPVMTAIALMPAAWRKLVDRYGYVDVYRAWRSGLSPAEVERRAEIAGGFFKMGGW